MTKIAVKVITFYQHETDYAFAYVAKTEEEVKAKSVANFIHDLRFDLTELGNGPAYEGRDFDLTELEADIVKLEEGGWDALLQHLDDIGTNYWIGDDEL